MDFGALPFPLATMTSAELEQVITRLRFEYCGSRGFRRAQLERRLDEICKHKMSLHTLWVESEVVRVRYALTSNTPALENR